MSLEIQSNNRIDIAVAPSLDAVMPLESFKSTTLRKEVHKLEHLVQKHSVCAFVVGWPLTVEGRMGASCGKVLHFLDTLLSKNQANAVLSQERPFTLYDPRSLSKKENCHFVDMNNGKSPNYLVPDEWGRSVCFSQVASPSFKNNTDSRAFSSCSDFPKNKTSAASLLEQFIEEHWQLKESHFNSRTNRRRIKNQLHEAHAAVDKMESDHMYFSPALL